MTGVQSEGILSLSILSAVLDTVYVVCSEMIVQVITWRKMAALRQILVREKVRQSIIILLLHTGRFIPLLYLLYLGFLTLCI